MSDNNRELSTVEEELIGKSESVQIQKAAWVAEQVQRQRRLEDLEREQLQAEQLLLEEMRKDLNTDLVLSKELQRYNEACEADIKEQVYGLHGISNDKLFGMQAYKTAYYQGLSVALFFISLVLTGFAGALYGLDSQMCSFMLMCTALEGALLSQEGRRGRFLDGICKGLYVLVTPLMAAVFVLYAFSHPAYSAVISVAVIVCAVLLVIGTIAYFTYNPYRSSKKFIRRAKRDLKELEQDAKQMVKKNTKQRQKEEARKERRDIRQEKRQIRKQKRKAKMDEMSANTKKFFGKFKKKKVDTSEEVSESVGANAEVALEAAADNAEAVDNIGAVLEAKSEEVLEATMAGAATTIEVATEDAEERVAESKSEDADKGAVKTQPEDAEDGEIESASEDKTVLRAVK